MAARSDGRARRLRARDLVAARCVSRSGAVATIGPPPPPRRPNQQPDVELSDRHDERDRHRNPSQVHPDTRSTYVPNGRSQAMTTSAHSTPATHADPLPEGQVGDPGLRLELLVRRDHAHSLPAGGAGCSTISGASRAWDSSSSNARQVAERRRRTPTRCAGHPSVRADAWSRSSPPRMALRRRTRHRADRRRACSGDRHRGRPALRARRPGALRSPRSARWPPSSRGRPTRRREPLLRSPVLSTRY